MTKRQIEAQRKRIAKLDERLGALMSQRVEEETKLGDMIRAARAIGGWECPAHGCGWADLSAHHERWAGDPCPRCKTPIVDVVS